MRFSVGYQRRAGDDLMEEILRWRDRVYEVYFSFGGVPNGRGSIAGDDDLLPHEAQARQLADLRRIADAGIPLNILYNGNCYGADAESRAFFRSVGDTVDYFRSEFGLASVTTTSPLIARFIKENFTDIATRASVNMEIGTVQGMDYLADVFDGYYMKREHNRNLPRIRRLSAWCRDHGKELFLLANSGCLNDCSSHIFHDNLVAHEGDIARMDNAYAFRGTCWDYLARPEKRVSLVRDTNYIRPEDMALYEGYFTAAKLATRVNATPARTVHAYMTGKHTGSVLELLEPNHQGILSPAYLDNRRFPADFATRVMTCDKNCDTCHYCTDVYRQALIQLEGTLC